METTQSLKFSVIMPCYNSEAYVRVAIESIINQTASNWELVAIDDGSKDATLEILNEYASKDNRIRIYSKPNGGYVSAINAGLEKVSGDYCLFLGSDDTLAEDLIEKLNTAASECLPDCITFRTILYRNNIAQGLDKSTDFSDIAYLSDTTLAVFSAAYPKHSAILFGRDTSKCYKRSVLGELRLWGRYGFDADGIFSMLFSHQARSFLAVPVDGYHWNIRGDSLSSQKRLLEQNCDRVRIWTDFYQQLLRLPLQEIATQEKQYLYYFLDAVCEAWSTADFSKRALISEACKTILTMEKKVGQPLSIGRAHRLLLCTPMLWKFLNAAKRS